MVARIHGVSIPFNREGISEQVTEESVKKTLRQEFPFPCTGKAFPNVYGEITKAITRDGFPFPSNGKAFPNPYPFKPLCASVSKAQLQTRIKLVIFFANDTTHQRKCQIFLIRRFFACAPARQELNAVQGCQYDTSRTRTPCDAQCVDILPRKSAAETVPTLPQTELYRRIRSSGQHALS